MLQLPWRMNGLLTARLQPVLFSAGGCSVAIGVGVAMSTDSRIAFVVVAAIVGMAALSLPASTWVLGAVVASLTFKGASSLGLLPGIATYLDLPLAWGALAIAWFSSHEKSRGTFNYLLWLGSLALAVMLAWAFHPAEVLRPAAYLALLAEPFAIIGALLLEPPRPSSRRLMMLILAGLVAIQVPIAAFQFMKFGSNNPDRIQGTLWGAGAGAHVMSAVIALGAIWLIVAKRRRFSLGAIAICAVLLAVPIVADAKQVLFVLPVAALVAVWRGRRMALWASACLAIGAVGVLFVVDPVSKQAVYNLQQARTGRNGKIETAKFVWRKLESDPVSVFFGAGPAESVSRAAFLTTDAFEHRDSSLRVLGLHPAPIALEAQKDATRVSGGNNTSFNSGVSSMLGVLGDLGVVGFLAYAAVLISVLRALSRVRTTESIAASAGWAMFGVLGLIYDWWEQPPFAVFLAVLTGLALCPNAPRTGHSRVDREGGERGHGFAGR